MSPSSPEPEFDQGVATLLDRVVELSARQSGTDPESFLAEVEKLKTDFRAIVGSRDEVELRAHFEDFARHRFTLVDDGSEYALAAEEVLVLSMVVSDAPESCTRALQESIITLSGVLLEPGVPPKFTQLLRRVRQIARQTGSSELRAWVDGVVAALPADDDPPP